MEQYAELTKERLLNIKCRVNETSVPRIFRFLNADRSPHNISTYDFEIPVKKVSNAPSNIFKLTIGNGLTVQGSDDHELLVEVSSARATQTPNVYFWRLFSVVEDHTWLNGDWEFFIGKYDGVINADEIILGDDSVVEIIMEGGQAAFDAQNANLVYAGPIAGAAAVPTFRALVAADLPTVPVAKGGTSLTGTGGIGTFMRVPFAGALGFSTMTLPNTAGAKTVLYAAAANVISATPLQSLLDTRTISAASAATLTPDIDLYDLFILSAQAEALLIDDPTGTAVLGNGFMIDLEDDGTPRAITYGALYTSTFVTLPTTTIAGKRMKLVFQYNGTNWELLNVINEQ